MWNSGSGGLSLPASMPRSAHETEALLDDEPPRRDDPRLLDVANQFVSEIIARAKEEATKKVTAGEKVLPGHVDEARSDERLMEMVRRFVSDIMTKAKAEAWDSMREIQNNNNNVLSEKDEAAAAAAGGGATGLASPGSTPGERLFRRGPWYVQMGRVFATFLSRICPCRCPTKP
ncbi:uncharacterized protein LOC134774314 [Penaeus indicus]|uniref:uncharacterized protein LOC134774314 n=1 Tax=Penaeus indicus TaxID=29960 RepID=UPI00300CBDA7